jgi:hypothetical protein
MSASSTLLHDLINAILSRDQPLIGSITLIGSIVTFLFITKVLSICTTLRIMNSPYYNLSHTFPPFYVSRTTGL